MFPEYNSEFGSRSRSCWPTMRGRDIIRSSIGHTKGMQCRPMS